MSDTPTYTCQSCGKFGLDKKEFKILVVMKIGFVTCLDCLKGFADG